MKRTEWAGNLKKSLKDPTKTEADKIATSKHIVWLNSDKTLDQIVQAVRERIAELDTMLLADRQHISLAETDYNMGRIRAWDFDRIVAQFYYHNDLQRVHGRFLDMLEVIIREHLLDE